LSFPLPPQIPVLEHAASFLQTAYDLQQRAKNY
jgi:hypothetical protein